MADKTFNISDGVYFVSKNVILDWLNNFFCLNLTKIEQCATGAVYCSIIDALYPGTFQFSKVKWNARYDYEFVENYRLLQVAFSKNGIKRSIDMKRLQRAKYQDNLEFVQFLKHYFDTNYSGEPYDALARRKNQDLFYLGGDNKVAQTPRAGQATKQTFTQPTYKKQTTTKSTMPSTTRASQSKKSSFVFPATQKSSNTSSAADQAKITQLKEQLDKNKLQHHSNEQEKDFFFNKLQDIDTIIQARKMEEKSAYADILKIVYAEEDENIKIAEDGKLFINDIDVSQNQDGDNEQSTPADELNQNQTNQEADKQDQSEAVVEEKLVSLVNEESTLEVDGKLSDTPLDEQAEQEPETLLDEEQKSPADEPAQSDQNPINDDKNSDNLADDKQNQESNLEADDKKSDTQENQESNLEAKDEQATQDDEPAQNDQKLEDDDKESDTLADGPENQEQKPVAEEEQKSPADAEVLHESEPEAVQEVVSQIDEQTKQDLNQSAEEQKVTPVDDIQDNAEVIEAEEQSNTPIEEQSIPESNSTAADEKQQNILNEKADQEQQAQPQPESNTEAVEEQVISPVNEDSKPETSDDKLSDTPVEH